MSAAPPQTRARIDSGVSSYSAWATGAEGTRSPMVFREGCQSLRGTSRVAGNTKV